MPAIFYFAALALAALGQEAKKVLQPLPRVWLIAPTAVVAGYLFFSNAFIYFDRQANDFASWNAFSAPETITGRKMAELGPDNIYILSPFLTNHPTTRFLAPHVRNQQFLHMPDTLPVRNPASSPVVMFIHPDDRWVFEKAKRFYPNADFEIFSGPVSNGNDDGPPSVYFVGLQPADLIAIQGLELRYSPASDSGDTSQLLVSGQSSRVFNINVTWSRDNPTEGNLVAEWDGILYIPSYGAYSFRLVTPGPGLLEIDGNILLEGQGEQLTGLPLAQGNHRIRVRANRAAGQVALYWQPPNQGESLVPSWVLYNTPVSNHGLLGSFYANNNWEGQPAFQRIDPFLDTYFHLIPLNRPYTVEWSGSLVAPQSGIYRLGLQVVQEAELYLDGQLLLSSIGPNQYSEAPISLEAGLHDLLIRYRDSVDRSRIHLSWVTPNNVFEPIPSEFLWPPMGRYPQTEPDIAQDTVEILPVALAEIVSLGSPGSQPGEFLEPRDVAILSNGNLVVADTGNKRVQIFDPQYNYRLELTGDELPFEEPVAVGVNSKDEIFVLDSTLQWVYRYDANGNFINRFGGPEVRLFHPRGLTVFADDNLALVDTGTSRLAFYNINGEAIGNLGSLGSDPGQLNEPTDVLRDALGTYFVVEAENNRIQRLDAAGFPLNEWAIPPAFAYNGPHLAFAPDGSILVTESQSRSVLRYGPSGILIDQWQGVDSVHFVAPVGIFFDNRTNYLYITDVVTQQVHVVELQPIVGPGIGED
jgi:DNA-binding beta-propeller fold protein YncE